MENKRIWLRELRKKSGLTIKEITESCGITETYLGYIENGIRRPSPQLAMKIANILGFDWRIFFEDKIQEHI